MNEEMEYQLKNLLKNNQPQDYIEIIEEENEEYIEIINNLQSKIDKARKIIDRYSRVVDYDDEVSIDVLYEIDDVLKEVE